MNSALDVIPLPGHPGMFARRVAVKAWQAAGSPRVNSAGRLYAVQKRLWDGWRKRLPGFSPADNPDNESQPLAHVRFVAFDINPTADRIKRLTAAGMVRPYSFEPWHWELPNVRSYGIVRSIPATASDTIAPITPEPEVEYDDMRKIYNNEKADASGRRHALVGPSEFQALTLSAAQEEWKLWPGDVLGVTQAEWDRFEARANARGGSSASAPAIDYVKLAAEIAKLPTAAEIAAEFIEQMKLPGN